MREKSRRVLTSLRRRSELRCATSSRSRSPAGKSEPASASSSGPSIKVSGVRNSWLTLEKNAVLARSISASASALALVFTRPHGRERSRDRHAEKLEKAAVGVIERQARRDGGNDHGRRPFGGGNNDRNDKGPVG